MNVGAFVCSCGDTCDIDLEGVREGVENVDVVASSSLLCEDGLPAMGRLIDEYELDQLIVTTPEPRCQRKFRALAEEKGLHPDATAFVDHREGAGWVHERAAASAKTARLINATSAGLAEEAVSRSVSREAGDRVAVVGDAETAAALADTADVTLVADGRDFADADVSLSDVAVERGRVVSVEGEFGDFELTLRSRVTDDCISCMECVREGPDGTLTSYPVDVDPEAEGGDWVDVCPTDAIDLDGVERTISADQVVYPGAARRSRGGRVGFYASPVDGATIAAVESLLGGVTKPDFLDLEMDVCAAGESSQVGCNACVEACPHEAVDRPTIDSVAFDKVACQNCGACTSSCPTGAVTLREPSNRRIAREVEALLDPTDEGGGWLFSRGRSGIETPVVAFVCSERAAAALRAYGRQAASGADVRYPPILPVRVNCADTAGEAHVLHALAAGADGVALVGCGEACLHSGPDPKADLVDRLNVATADLGLGERVAFFAPESDDPDSFVEAISAFEAGLDPSPVPAGDHEATGGVDADEPNPPFNTHDWALESVRALLERVEPERSVIRGLETFGRMEVSEACNLTPTCSNLCPADAIRRTTDGDLQFDHEDCVNCGLCESGCPETAITMESGLDLSLLPENRDGDRWVTVFEGEMLECARCGTPFTSRGSAEKIRDEVGDLVEGIAPDADRSIFEYCGQCRATLLFERGGR
ncbi:hydrogenase iron-sulfur subunit [Halegenticoccus soli]|uniref:hydrogenase iron-sulfur subunit n=1 Tax=Halegenticoccus soli TaxID=1985678 RepID=UPI000C6ED8BF|nr:hydrogenase iron-sulfur subunit [Halegenticoccus soli]